MPAAQTPADGASPAPAPLDRVQSLVNSLGGEGAGPAADPLLTREDAGAWLRAAALLPAEGGLSTSEHTALLRLREAVRDVLAARTAGHRDAAAADRLTRTLAEGRIAVTVDPLGAVHLASAARSSYPGLVAAIAVAIAESAAAGTWLRLRLCSAPGCGVAFYDGSASAAATRCAAHAAGAAS